MTIDKDKAITVLGIMETEMTRIGKQSKEYNINMMTQAIGVLAKIMKDMISQPPE